jgi:hypothetical protein
VKINLAGGWFWEEVAEEVLQWKRFTKIQYKCQTIKEDQLN